MHSRVYAVMQRRLWRSGINLRSCCRPLMHLCMNAFTFTGKNAKAHTDLQTLQNNANSILKSSLLIFLRCFNVTFIFHLVLLLDIFAFN